MRRATLIGLLSCGIATATSCRPVHSAEPLGLGDSGIVVEHDGPAEVRLGRHDALMLAIWLRNTSARPIPVAYGSPLFHVSAQPLPREGADAGPILRLPQPSTWGERRRLEFPNPDAAHTAVLTRTTMRPNERFGRVTYRLPAPGPDRYLLDVCARVNDGLRCSRDRILLQIDP